MPNTSNDNTHLQAILDTVLDGIITIDSKGLIQSFNAAAIKIFGYEPEEVVGQNVKMLMPDPYHSEHDSYLKNHLDTGEKKVIGIGRLVSAKRKDGSIFPMELGVNDMIINGKKMFVGIIRDLSEVQNSRNNLQAILDTVIDGIITIDSKGLIQSFNAAAINIFGYEPEEVVGQNVKVLMPDPYQSEHDTYLNNHLDTGEKKVIGIGRLVSAKRKDGSIFPIELGVNDMIVNGKKMFVGIIRDPSKQAISKQLFRELSEQMELILDNAGEGIYGLDLNGYTTFANKAAVEMLGYTPEEMVGKSQHSLIHHHFSDGSEYPRKNCNIYQAFIDGKEHKEDTEVFWKKDGTPLPIEYTSRPIRNSKNEITGAVVVFHDITERKQHETEQENLIAKLSDSNEELERFAYLASHDLQEPLRMIRNFTQLLEKKLKGKLDEDAQKYLDISRNSAIRMQNLVEDLLQYARVGEEDQERFESVDCNNTLEYIKENLNERLAETQTKITYNNLPIITANPIQISQVLQNLISNAIKYQKAGTTPEINISATEQNDNWEFRVQDNGIGMKQEYCKQIFQPFKRLHNATEYSGTGIGLAICRKIIQKKGGEIWAESIPDKGSSFYFTIPKLAKKT